jgi:hypothetical protein
MFEIGDKVVCVDDSPGRSNGLKLLVRDRLYVIERVNDLGGDDVGFWIVGIPECPWRYTRFRKLSDMQAEARERRKERQPA